MQFEWKVDPADINRVKTFVDSHTANPLCECGWRETSLQPS